MGGLQLRADFTKAPDTVKFSLSEGACRKLRFDMQILFKSHARLAALFGCAALLAACGKQTSQPPPKPQVFAVKGVVLELKPDGKTVLIRHEAISNYMAAMIMPFEVHNTNLLRGLQRGDAVTFNLAVTPNEGWIESMTKIQGAARLPAALPATGVRLSHALEPLDEGDALPDYSFTNELGQAVSLGQFRGQVLAFTFFFTSCPFPDFCPRMTGNFARAEKELEAMADAPARWRLLSISFDPAHDTPARLADYARAAHYDPSHWSFLTGEEKQIGDLADQMGENYWHEGTSIGHNLRTVVVDPRGRIRKIIPGNKWDVGQLVQEIVKAGRL
jgi:protein SCO1/2